MVGPGWWCGRPAVLFLFFENTFAESFVGLLAHVCREGPRMLSAKTSSPVEWHREAITESFLSVRLHREETCVRREYPPSR
jgi:hypothetical protein